MKRIPVLAILSLAVLIAACSKDKFQTKPRIEVKSYSSKEIPRNGTLILRLNYFDKEGDIGEGHFYLFRQRTNKIPANAEKPDILNYTLPVFTNKDQGEIRLDLQEVNFLSEDTRQNDTMFFKIAVTDRAGNTSDTLVTDQIVVLLP
jgi:hypothetical protein